MLFYLKLTKLLETFWSKPEHDITVNNILNKASNFCRKFFVNNRWSRSVCLCTYWHGGSTHKSALYYIHKLVPQFAYHKLRIKLFWYKKKFYYRGWIGLWLLVFFSNFGFRLFFGRYSTTDVLHSFVINARMVQILLESLSRSSLS